MPNPQGFRLTKEERAMLQAGNGQYEKPLPGEIEIMDKLNFEAPERMWKWRKVSELLLSEKIRSVEDQKKDKADRRRRIEIFLRMLEAQEECVVFDPYAFVALIDKVYIRSTRMIIMINNS